MSGNKLYAIVFFLLVLCQAQAANLLIEAETFVREGGPDKVKITPDRPGTLGKLCVTGSNSAGHWLEWDIDVPADGQYQLVLRYSQGRDWNTWREVLIDGQSPGAAFRKIELPSSGGFGRTEQEWKNIAVQDGGKPALLKLTRGKHVLRITNLGGEGENGSANLDVIALLEPHADPALAIVVPKHEVKLVEITPNPADYAMPLPASTVKTFAMKSAALGGKILKMNVYLPKGYSRTERYPVLYLFHGLSSDQTYWMPNLDLEKRADALIAAGKIKPLIIVAPQLEASWGLNSANENKVLSSDSRMPFVQGRYRDYFVGEVVPYIERHFSTLASRESRMIGGASMGGFAALHIGFSYPELFGKIGGHSPAVSIGTGDYAANYLYPDETAIQSRHPRFLANSKDLSTTKVRLDCGENDGLITATRELFASLQEKKIRVEMHSAPGGHFREYWMAHLDEYLQFYAGK